ncbi:MAG: hypothetical protein AAB586_02520 [Patescibacteria group bacterium]
MRINKNLVLGLVMTGLVCGVSIWLGYSLDWRQVVIIFLVSYPWTISNGDICSMWGGFSETGSVYSLVGIVQVAGETAFHFFGISLCQIAGQNAWQMFGISFYQAAKNTYQVIGISFCQIAEQDAEQGAGISCCQIAGDNLAWQGIGISVYQRASHLSNTVSIPILRREMSSTE